MTNKTALSVSVRRPLDAGNGYPRRLDLALDQDISTRSYLAYATLSPFISLADAYEGSSPLFREARRLARLGESLCDQSQGGDISGARVYVQLESQVDSGDVMVTFNARLAVAVTDSWRLLSPVIVDRLVQKQPSTIQEAGWLARDYGEPLSDAPEVLLWLPTDTLTRLNDLQGEQAFLQGVQEAAEDRFGLQAVHAQVECPPKIGRI